MCWHKWSKWRVMRDPQYQTMVIRIQVRKCTKCGKTQTADT